MDQEARTVATGYSGSGIHKNDPDSQALANLGPIPCGRYTIGAPQDTVTHGPYVLPLMPHVGNEMHMRSHFLIHGDSVVTPGSASEGCVILSRAVRQLVWESNDHLLEVVSGKTENLGDIT